MTENLCLEREHIVNFKHFPRAEVNNINYVKLISHFRSHILAPLINIRSAKKPHRTNYRKFSLKAGTKYGMI